jgi:hypothetical protein
MGRPSNERAPAEEARVLPRRLRQDPVRRARRAHPVPERPPLLLDPERAVGRPGRRSSLQTSRVSNLTKRTWPCCAWSTSTATTGSRSTSSRRTAATPTSWPTPATACSAPTSRISGAQEAYDNCFEEGTSGGMGAIRLRARYEDEDDDEDTRQRIAIEPIYEADTCVFFSPGRQALRQGGREALLRAQRSMTPGRLRRGVRRQPGQLAQGHHQGRVRLVHAGRGVGGRGLRDRGKDRAGALLPRHRPGDDEPNDHGGHRQELQDDPGKLDQLRPPASARCARSAARCARSTSTS